MYFCFKNEMHLAGDWNCVNLTDNNSCDKQQNYN